MSDFLPEGKWDNQEIRKILSEQKYVSDFEPSKELIDSIISQFWFHDFYNSFISDPFFLEYLTKYLEGKKPRGFNRYDFYKFLFQHLLKKGSNKDIPHQIALRFELAQTDAIELSDYEKLLRELRSPKGFFDVAWAEKSHLAKVEDREGKKYFVWQHHTITEFLVTEYLTEKKETMKEFENLAVLNQEGVIALKPSWQGVLRFLLESEKSEEVGNWLIRFLKQHPDNLDDQIAEVITFEDIKGLDEKEIFDLIYESYFQRIVWLPVWVRGRLAKFVDEKTYQRLKEDIKEWSNETETFVRRGNVVSITEGLLEYNNPLLTNAERKFWREKLIEFANDKNENGVLQRHSVAALAHFRDEKIITLVAKNNFDDTQDTLRKDAFLQFCTDSAPNSRDTIHYLIEGIKRGSDIYARHGLFKVTQPKSIKYFLTQTVEDKRFWEQFLHHESIFSAEKKKGDHILLENIEKAVNDQLINLLKRIIKLLFEDINFYHEARSSFIRKIGLIIQNRDPNYLVEIIERIKSPGNVDKIDKLIFDYEDFLAILINEKNIEKFFGSIKNFPSTRLRPEATVYVARRENGEVGQKVYEKAVKLKLVPPIPKDISRSFENQEKERRRKTYESFLKQLQPAPGKYQQSVFQYFLQTKKDIEEQWKPNDKKRLIKLAIEDGLKKIDPKQFKVSIKDKNNKTFSWTAVASYYGAILAVANALRPQEISKYRQNIIDFIPYAFSEDMSRILELVPEVKDKELSFVNKVMGNKKDDRRYLVPDSYVYIVGQYAKRGCKLPSVKAILKSFLGDGDIEDHVRRNALETLGLFTNANDNETKSLLQKIFDKEKGSELGKTANSHLITIYKDEKALDWRFQKLKEPIEFAGFQKEAHAVGHSEEELTSMPFAQPLIALKDRKYLPRFLDLLRYSIDIANKDSEAKFKEYVNYLWKVVMSFVEGLKTEGSFKPLELLETYIDFDEISKGSGGNWLKIQLSNTRNKYVDTIGRQLKPKISRIWRVSAKTISDPILGKDISEKSEVGYSPDTKKIKTEEDFADFMRKPLKIFISHASAADEPRGVKKFVADLATKIKAEFGENAVFFDESEDLNSINLPLDKAIRESRYCVVIYTKRYHDRYQQNGTITSEANSFFEVQKEFQRDLTIVVLYDLERSFVSIEGIYFLRDKKHVKTASVPSREYPRELNLKSREVIDRIKKLENKYKKEIELIESKEKIESV